MDIKKTMNTIIISDDEEDKNNNSVKPTEKNLEERRCSYKDNLETLIVTKKVKIKKQKIRCIINIPSTFLDAKTQKCRKKHCKKSYHQPGQSHNRILPKCRRKKCVDNLTPCCRTTGEIKKHKNHKRRCNEVEKSRILLSPVSNTPLEDDSDNNISYDDISDGSFYSDVDLERLIKRTKNREKNTGESHAILNKLFHNTPKKYLEDDEATVYSEDMDVSLHSLPTVVLEPNNDYISLSSSPEYMQETFFTKHEPYSPTMDLEDLQLEQEEKYNGHISTDLFLPISQQTSFVAIKQEDSKDGLMMKIELSNC